VDIKIPTIGESITEGTIAQWLKKDGDPVHRGEALFELETEKATTEVPSPADGVLRISTAEGKTVPIGAVIGTIEEGTKSAQPANAVKSAERPSVAAKNDKAAPERKVQPPLSPSARRLAREAKLQPAEASAADRQGLVAKEDVVHNRDQQRTAAAPAATPDGTAAVPPSEPTVAATRETRQPMSAIRQRIAERLLASQKKSATLTTFNEADLSAVMDLRARYKDRFREKHGVGLGFMSFFLKAAVEALRAYPVVNAWIDQTDIVYHHYYNIGVAVSTEKGLMVPVLRDADRLSFAAIEKALAELADKARNGKISVPDLQGGTFTITNGGIYGSMLSTPILNPPQSAILGMHAETTDGGERSDRHPADDVPGPVIRSPVD
jgi:2-oxoglutarate dehydrogenase E2 component (dihydrolipoamide succinyltransferase)